MLTTREATFLRELIAQSRATHDLLLDAISLKLPAEQVVRRQDNRRIADDLVEKFITHVTKKP